MFRHHLCICLQLCRRRHTPIATSSLYTVAVPLSSVCYVSQVIAHLQAVLALTGDVKSGPMEFQSVLIEQIAEQTRILKVPSQLPLHQYTPGCHAKLNLQTTSCITLMPLVVRLARRGESGFLTAHTSISKLCAEFNLSFSHLCFFPCKCEGFRQAEARLQSLLGLHSELQSYGLQRLSM